MASSGLRVKTLMSLVVVGQVSAEERNIND